MGIISDLWEKIEAFKQMLHYDLLLVGLSFVGCLASIIDALAGGGGLLTLPTLLMTGLAPATALGTNKFQGCVGELNASVHFFRKRKIHFRELRFGLLLTALGTTLGTWLIQCLHAAIARQIIPWLLLGILLYVVFVPQVSAQDAKKRLKQTTFYLVFGLLVGFYNGFFGPGTGSIWVFVLMFFLGMNIVNGTMHAKPLNFTGNVFSLIWFIIGGNVNYPFALAMTFGQLIGSKLGAHLVIAKGDTLIRPLYITVVSITMIIYFLKSFGVI